MVLCCVVFGESGVGESEDRGEIQPARPRRESFWKGHGTFGIDYSDNFSLSCLGACVARGRGCGCRRGGVAALEEMSATWVIGATWENVEMGSGTTDLLIILVFSADLLYVLAIRNENYRHFSPRIVLFGVWVPILEFVNCRNDQPFVLDTTPLHPCYVLMSHTIWLRSALLSPPSRKRLIVNKLGFESRSKESQSLPGT